jgi:hypothetical protein
VLFGSRPSPGIETRKNQTGATMNVTEKMLRDENQKLRDANGDVCDRANKLQKEVFRLERENARLKRVEARLLRYLDESYEREKKLRKELRTKEKVVA